MTSFIIIFIICVFLLFIVIYQNWLLKILEKSRNNFRIFVDSSPYPFLFTDNELNVKTLSKSTADLFSTDIRSIINHNIRTFISYDVYLQEKLKNRNNEFLMLSAQTNKDKIPLECTIYSPFRQNDYFFWFLRDIRKDIDLQFFFQRMIDYYPFGFMKLDYKGNILQINKKFKDIFNFNNYSNLHITLFFYWHNYYKIIENIRVHGFETHEIEFDSKSLKKDLEFFFFNTPINEPSIYCFIQDITSINELHQNLDYALKEQRKLSLEKDIFFAKMNHEIRTPLNTIIGMTDLLYENMQKESNYEMHREFLCDIRKSSKHLMDIVNEILDFNKISTGKMELNEEVFDLFELLSETIFSFKNMATQKGLIFNIDYPDNISGFFWADKIKINQIFYNLLSNSIKFTDEGSITISIKSEIYEIVNHRKIYALTVSITDTGIGIPEEERDKLFKPFKQVTHGKYKGGTGLGLYISRELARLMGGDISFKSVVGQGATFIAKLRLKEALEEEKPKIENKSIKIKDNFTSTPSDNKNEEKKQRGDVLIVDDVAMNRKVLRIILEKNNWKTIEAASGKEALEILDKSNAFNLIFMDISMPEMDGIQTLNKLREKNINIPVIACTAYALSGDRDKFLDHGFNGYLPKPVTYETLIKEMDFVLKQFSSLNISDEIEHDFSGQIPVDYQKLIETCNGLEYLARELLNDLINQSPLWLKEAEISVQELNIQRIRKISHLVSGTASTIHAFMLFEKSKNLGEIAKENKIEKLSDAFNEFRGALDFTLKWARKKLQEN